MPIVLTGSDLTIDDVVAVARTNATTTLAPEATARMAATRAIVDRILERGDEVYGLNTGVGVLKRVGVPAHAETLASFNLAMVRAHRVSAGGHAPPDVARATMVCLANTLAVGAAGVRPAVVELLIARLNAGTVPTIRVLGSIGQADLAAMADLALDIADELALAPGEALALLDNNAFSTAWAALALSDAQGLVASMEAAGALSLEAFGANLTMIHPVTDAIRPYPGLAASRATPGRLPRRQPPLRTGRAATPAGSAHVPEPAADPRRHARRARVRGATGHDRAERVAGEPGRRPRGGPA